VISGGLSPNLTFRPETERQTVTKRYTTLILAIVRCIVHFVMHARDAAAVRC